MYADAMMNLRPWELWSLDGQPAADTLELVSVLETVLRRYPNHPGANHYYIHAVEASPTPERALASAARLETLVPGAGHLVHMPTHIYMHTGDLDRIASLNAEGGRRRRALLLARQSRGRLSVHVLRPQPPLRRRGPPGDGPLRRLARGREEDGGPGGAARRGDGADGRVGHRAPDAGGRAVPEVGRDPLGAEAAGVADADDGVRLVRAGGRAADDREEGRRRRRRPPRSRPTARR